MRPRHVAEIPEAVGPRSCSSGGRLSSGGPCFLLSLAILVNPPARLPGVRLAAGPRAGVRQGAPRLAQQPRQLVDADSGIGRETRANVTRRGCAACRGRRTVSPGARATTAATGAPWQSASTCAPPQDGQAGTMCGERVGKPKRSRRSSSLAMVSAPGLRRITSESVAIENRGCPQFTRQRAKRFGRLFVLRVLTSGLVRYVDYPYSPHVYPP